MMQMGPVPPSLFREHQLPKGTVLDWSGNPIDPGMKPSAEPIARAGRVRDPWLLQLSLDVTPESLAHLIRNDYPLPQQMALCNRMLDNDAHLASVYRDLVGAAVGLDWEILPFDDSPEAQKYTETCSAWATAKSEEIEELLPQIVAGEFYPLAGAGIRWDLAKFLPESFVEIDPVRWYWEPQTNSLKIRTLANPWFGEDLPPNEFITYRSALRPGKGREGGLWRPAAWLYLFKHFTLSEWMQFAEIYGKPFRVAYYNRKEERDAIYQAMLDLGANAAGVFPVGTVIELKEANRSGAVDVYKQLREACNDEMSELFVGHPLITHAKSGSGTLAGNAAQMTFERIIRTVARRVGRAVNRSLLRPIVTFQHGQAAIEKTPHFKLKYEPSDDEEKKAQTFVFLNEVLQAVGQAIDPEQVKETFNITNTVPRTAPAAPAPFGGKPGGGAPGGGDGIPEGSEGDRAAASRRLAHESAGRQRQRAVAATPLETADDVERVAAGIGKKSLQQFGKKLLDTAEKAKSIDEFMAACWEQYSNFDTTKLASMTRDAIVTADVIGRGEID